MPLSLSASWIVTVYIKGSEKFQGKEIRFTPSFQFIFTNVKINGLDLYILAYKNVYHGSL